MDDNVFPKNSYCDLDRITLTFNLFEVFLSNTCMKLYQNWIINEIATDNKR